MNNKPHCPVVFVSESNQQNAIFNQIKSSGKENIQIIVNDKLSKGNSKNMLQDVIGEIRFPDSNRAMDSTLLVSGFDSYYGSTELSINFPETGAGFLTHVAITRGLFYLSQQYRDFRHNLMSYFSSTRFKNYTSLDFFFKKNDHSHFTTGIEKIVVFNKLNGSKSLTIKVYNVASKGGESAAEELEFIQNLQTIGKRHGISLNVSTSPNTYFKDFKNPTFVIDDAYDGKNFSISDLSSKIFFL